ncbi:carboxypeptidase regulatory-like domain-containing protein [Archaeoglobus sp.]
MLLPDPTNNTALTFTVLDSETKEAISGAYVTVNGKTKITNSNGFTWFEVPKNNTYSYTVSAQGYFTISGSVEVGDNQKDVTVELMPISATPTTTAGGSGGTTGSTAGSLNEGIQELYSSAPALIRLAILVAMMSMFGMLMRAVRRR